MSFNTSQYATIEERTPLDTKMDYLRSAMKLYMSALDDPEYMRLMDCNEQEIKELYQKCKSNLIKLELSK